MPGKPEKLIFLSFLSALILSGATLKQWVFAQKPDKNLNAKSAGVSCYLMGNAGLRAPDLSGLIEDSKELKTLYDSGKISEETYKTRNKKLTKDLKFFLERYVTAVTNFHSVLEMKSLLNTLKENNEVDDEYYNRVLRRLKLSFSGYYVNKVKLYSDVPVDELIDFSDETEISYQQGLLDEMQYNEIQSILSEKLSNITDEEMKQAYDNLKKDLKDKLKEKSLSKGKYKDNIKSINREYKYIQKHKSFPALNKAYLELLVNYYTGKIDYADFEICKNNLLKSIL